MVKTAVSTLNLNCSLIYCIHLVLPLGVVENRRDAEVGDGDLVTDAVFSSRAGDQLLEDMEPVGDPVVGPL